MRRIVMLLGMAMLLVAVAAGVAVAVDKTCENIPCYGTNNDDVLIEREGNNKADRIYGLDGSDDIDANNWRLDRDRLFGGRNGDRLLTNDNDGADLASGGRGSDKCIVDRGDQTRGCNNVNVQAAGLEPAGFGVTPLDEQ